MSVTDSVSGAGWEHYIEANVLVSVFTDKSAFDEVDEVNRTFLELVDSPRVNATVACIEMDGSAGNRMLEGAEEAAKEGIDRGLEKWAIADPGIGKLAIKNHVDIDGLRVEGFDSRDEAIEWAKD